MYGCRVILSQNQHFLTNLNPILHSYLFWLGACIRLGSFLDLPPLIDRQLIDRQLIDWQLINRQLIDQQLIDLLIGRPTIDRPTIDQPRQLIDPYNWSTQTINRPLQLINPYNCCFGVRSPFLLNFLAKIFSFYFVPTYLLQAYFWGLRPDGASGPS
jgi:hypothetical protein